MALNVARCNLCMSGLINSLSGHNDPASLARDTCSLRSIIINMTLSAHDATG